MVLWGIRIIRIILLQNVSVFWASWSPHMHPSFLLGTWNAVYSSLPLSRFTVYMWLWIGMDIIWREFLASLYSPHVSYLHLSHTKFYIWVDGYSSTVPIVCRNLVVVMLPHWAKEEDVIIFFFFHFFFFSYIRLMSHWKWFILSSTSIHCNDTWPNPFQDYIKITITVFRNSADSRHLGSNTYDHTVEP